MLVSIIGENMFKVGEKIFQVGDEVKLDEVPPIEIPGFGSMVAEDLRQKLVGINAWIRETKQKLLQDLHTNEEVYDEGMAVLCWEYANSYRDWAFYVDLLFKGIERHLGGGPPLLIDPESGKVTIRAMKGSPNEANAENLNWTRTMVARQVQFQRYEGIRAVVKQLFGEHANAAHFDIELLTKTTIPCITLPIDTVADQAIVDSKDPMDGVTALAKAGTEAFAALQAMVPVCLVWVTKERYIFADMREKIMPQQQQPGQPPMPPAVVLQQAQTHLGEPEHVGLLMFGDLGHITTGRSGLVACSISASSEHHCALAVDGDKFTQLSAGDGLKIEENLGNVLQGLFKKEEEEK